MRRLGFALALWALLAASAPAAVPAPPARPASLPPRLLPGDVSAAGASTHGWLIGAVPSPRSDEIARRHGARRVLRGAAVFRVPVAAARPFAHALRTAGLYAFSEPNATAAPRSYPPEPSLGQQWALGAIGASALTPPPVHDGSPLLAIVDEGFDGAHPEWQGARIQVLNGLAFGLHQNAVASVAGAPANGAGIAGVWPGMRLALAGASDCASTARSILAAVDAGASVINMSYAFPGGCYTHRVATNLAFGAGAVLVAAAGNDGTVSGRGDSPAEDPHVLTVAALAPGDLSPAWSNANGAIDLAAPGESVLAAVPPSLDVDGVADGYGALHGTSFSAPIVAAATAWVRQLRPRLDHTQATELVRTATRDLGRGGWDPVFGFGAFDLPTALSAPAPRPDLMEPNDDVQWIDGSIYVRADAPVWRGHGSRRFASTLDQLEDPVDVYAILLPPRSWTRIVVTPLYGDPDVIAYDRRARTVYGSRGFLAGSERRGRRLDVIWLENRSRTRRKAYLALYPKERSNLAAGYRLRVARAG